MYKLLFLLFLTFATQAQILKHPAKKNYPIDKLPGYFYIFNTGKIGVIDSLNKTVIPVVFDRLEYKSNVFVATINKKHGLISLANEVITPIVYDWVLARPGNRFLLRLNDHVSIIDNRNNEILPFSRNYVDIDNYLDKFYVVKNESGKSGILDFNGKAAIPEEYVFFNIDSTRIFCTHKDKPLILNFPDTTKNIYLNESIKFVKQERHYSAHELFNQVFMINGKCGLLKSDNTILVPPIYDELISVFMARTFIAKQNNKYGVITYYNKLLTNIEFDSYFEQKSRVVFSKKGTKKISYYYDDEFIR